MKLVRPKNYTITIVFVSIALFFSHLDLLFVNIMEARNFITAREMVANNNWFLTTINLEPLYEKPSLTNWITALSGMIFGFKNILVMRAPAALSGVFLVLMLYHLSKSLLNDKKQSFINALILATSFYIIYLAREGTSDIFAYTFMLGAIWFIFKFFENDYHRWNNSLFAAVLIGFSLMSKVSLGVFSLLIPFLVAYAIVYKFKKLKSKWIPLLIGILLAVLISNWWPFYVYFTDTKLVALIADKEITINASNAEQPWYHYWSFPIQAGLWVFPAFMSMMYPYLKSRVENLKVYQFTLIWILVSIISLSIIPEKEEKYLAPVLIPIAISIGFYIRYLIKQGINLKAKIDLYPVYFGFGIIGLVGIIFPFVGYFFLIDKFIGDYWTWYIITAFIIFLCSIFLITQLIRKNFGNVFKAIIVFQVSITVFGFPLAKSFYNNESFKNIHDLHTIEKEHQIKSYSFGNLSPEFIWEYDGNIKNIYQHHLQLPTDNSFGLLVDKNQKEAFLQLFKDDFEISYITQFDLNYTVNKQKIHRIDRLVRDYYILKNTK